MKYGVQLDLWDIDEVSLCLFVCFAVKFVAAGSLFNYLYAIRHAYLSKGLHNPLRPGLSLTRVVRELKIREKGFVKYRMSLSVAYLLRMFKASHPSTHDERCVKAAICLAVFLLLRVGEVVSTGLLRSDWRHVTSRDLGALLLRFSKADQFGKGFVLLCFKVGSVACPFTAMRRYIRKSAVELPPDGPLFVLSSGKRMSRAWLLRATQALLWAADIPTEAFSGISFRKGGAFSLASVRVNDRVIRALGRWKGWCYDRYIELTVKHIRKAQMKMLACKSDDWMTAKDAWRMLK
jgi:hypothetical protein